MNNTEEAEILENGGVVIRYYFGKTVLIPVEVMKREAIEIDESDDAFKGCIKELIIKSRPRRFNDGGL